MRGLESGFILRIFLEKILGYSQSGVMNYMFKLGDAVTRVKRQEDVTEDSSETVVAPDILRQDVPPGVRMLSLQCL